MGIDPWSDLESVQGLLRPSEEVYTIDDDVVAAIESMDSMGAVAPMSLPSGDYTLKISTVAEGIDATASLGLYYGGHWRNFTSGDVPVALNKGFTVVSGGRYPEGSSIDYQIIFDNKLCMEVTSNVNYPASEYKEITLNGRLAFYPLIRLYMGSREHNVTMPTSQSMIASLTVNGTPLEDTVVLHSDSVTVDNLVLSTADYGDITSIGIRIVTYGECNSGSGSKSDVTSVDAGFMIGDTLTITADGKPSGGVDEETKGLLATIIGWLTQIKDGITGVASAIASLPRQIFDLMMNGLKYLFIPSGTDLNDIKDNYTAMFEERFGFIADIFGMLDSFFRTLVDNWSSHTDYTFQFPEISFTMQGTKYTIIQSQAVSLDNDLMSVLRPVVGTFFSFICVLGCFHSLETMFIAVVSGKNYFDYLREVPSDDN